MPGGIPPGILYESFRHLAGSLFMQAARACNLGYVYGRQKVTLILSTEATSISYGVGPS
jgi:hypothetical protein